MFPAAIQSRQQNDVLLFLCRPEAAAGVDAVLRWLGLDVTEVRNLGELCNNSSQGRYAFIVTEHNKIALIKEHARLPVIEVENFLFRQFDGDDACSVSNRFDASAFIDRVLALVETPQQGLH